MDPTLQPDSNSPWWAMAGASAVGLILAIAKAYFWIRGKLNTVSNEERKLEIGEREEARRAAAEEAWQLNARLMDIIKGHETKIDAIQKKCDDAVRHCEDERRKCETDRAEMLGRLRVIEAWAAKKGLPLSDPPYSKNSDSSTHTALPESGGS